MCVCVCDAQDFSINAQTARFNSYCLPVCVCVTPNHFNKLHSVCEHISPLCSIVRNAAMFGLRSVRPFLPLYTTTRLCTECASLTHPAAHMCMPHSLRRAPAGEPAQALGDGVTDVTLPCCMRVGVWLWLCAEPRLSLPAKEKPPAAACPPPRVSNSRSMVWVSSAFPVYYYLMWLETCLHNHQDNNFRVVPMLHFISVYCHGGSARAAQRRAR